MIENSDTMFSPNFHLNFLLINRLIDLKLLYVTVFWLLFGALLWLRLRPLLRYQVFWAGYCWLVVEVDGGGDWVEFGLGLGFAVLVVEDYFLEPSQPFSQILVHHINPLHHHSVLPDNLHYRAKHILHQVPYILLKIIPHHLIRSINSLRGKQWLIVLAATAVNWAILSVFAAVSFLFISLCFLFLFSNALALPNDFARANNDLLASKLLIDREFNIRCF
jgi:hypothetical protein